jgi:hypothetical protein
MPGEWSVGRAIEWASEGCIVAHSIGTNATAGSVDIVGYRSRAEWNFGDIRIGSIRCGKGGVVCVGSRNWRGGSLRFDFSIKCVCEKVLVTIVRVRRKLKSFSRLKEDVSIQALDVDGIDVVDEEKRQRWWRSRKKVRIEVTDLGDSERIVPW